MLPEAIVAEQDVVPRHIGEHRVRPVKHGRLNKDELCVAELQRIAGLHRDKIPVLMIEAAQNRLTLLRAVNRCIRNLPHQSRQGTAVIIFVMIHDDAVNVF